jgi:TRAP-type mannitol/chloroaromatic compound transport system substrate-binding protein
MKRRDLVMGATAAIATGGYINQNSAITQTETPPATQTDNSPAVTGESPQIRWRMATSWDKTLDIAFGSAKTLCQRVSQMTSGKFTITPYAAGELASGLEVMDAIKAGTVECGHTTSQYYVNKNPALAFAASMPFGLNPHQQNSWLYHGGGLELIQKLYSDFGMINFPAGNTSIQMGGWFTKKINNIHDLQGLRMRISGLGGEVMQRLGVDVQILLGEQIVDALVRGELDAAEWVGPYEDEQLGLHKIAPYYYYPGWWEPGTTREVQVSLKQWQRLPKDYQAIFRAAATEANMRLLAQYDAVNGSALKRLVLGGTKLEAYSEEILKAAHRATFDWYEEQSQANSQFRDIYQQWLSFRREAYDWNRINELSFADFVGRSPINSNP